MVINYFTINVLNPVPSGNFLFSTDLVESLSAKTRIMSYI